MVEEQGLEEGQTHSLMEPLIHVEQHSQDINRKRLTGSTSLDTFLELSHKPVALLRRIRVHRQRLFLQDGHSKRGIYSQVSFV